MTTTSDRRPADRESKSRPIDSRDGRLGRRRGHRAVVRLIDQTRLPTEFVEIDCRDVPAVWEAIRSLRVRGAPAIGIAAAYGAVLGGQVARLRRRRDAVRARPRRGDRLPPDQPADGRQPVLGLDRMDRCLADADRDRRPPPCSNGCSPRPERSPRKTGRCAARSAGIGARADRSPGRGCSTHCNAGGLATADYGTALAVIFAAHEQGKPLHVFADETRPLLQGARLTAWELQRRGIPVTLICDNMAAQVMKEGKVQMVVVGADRIAANGDTANKIGTYGVALLAQAHGIPFYVAAPSSTFDLSHPRRLRHPDRAARPARDHPRLRPPDRPRRGSTSTTPPSTSPPPA